MEIELFTQEYYKQGIEPEENLSELYKDTRLCNCGRPAGFGCQGKLNKSK